MRRLALVLGLALLAVPSIADAQAGACQLIDSQTFERRTQAGFQTIYIVAPVVSCTGGARITANEGTLYEVSREIHMNGNVDFRDPERRLRSQHATYSSVTGRLWATGDVVFTDLTEGMTLRGPELEYYRAMPGRPQSHAIATQRPHLTLLPRTRPGEERVADAEPVEIDADRMTMMGNEQYTATGRVEIQRSDFQAFSHEARVDQMNERMELRGRARIQGEQFDLMGEAIDLALPGDRLERILAQRDAELIGEDLRIDAQEIQLFFADDLLQRMVARQGGTSNVRPIATARAFRLEADSLDALTPGQRLDRVIAIGTARGESLDTTNVPQGRIARAAAAGTLTAGDRDWILGDTVISYFAAATGDTATGDTAAVETAAAFSAAQTPPPEGEMQMERIVARGAAQSLYRIENSQNGTRQRPGLNYLVGETIELNFRDGELSVADVRGLQRGLYLDPEEAPATPDEEPVPAPPGEAPADVETPVAQG
jgi:lipopolysaccharide export system protein LptA